MVFGITLDKGLTRRHFVVGAGAAGGGLALGFHLPTVIAANQVGLLIALFKQLAGSLLLRHTGIQFSAIHSFPRFIQRNIIVIRE